MTLTLPTIPEQESIVQTLDRLRELTAVEELIASMRIGLRDELIHQLTTGRMRTKS